MFRFCKFRHNTLPKLEIWLNIIFEIIKNEFKELIMKQQVVMADTINTQTAEINVLKSQMHNLANNFEKCIHKYTKHSNKQLHINKTYIVGNT